jgi:hypothetical protein
MVFLSLDQINVHTTNGYTCILIHQNHPKLIWYLLRCLIVRPHTSTVVSIAVIVDTKTRQGVIAIGLSINVCARVDDSGIT